MRPLNSGPDLYTLKADRELIGINTNYVDDLLLTG